MVIALFNPASAKLRGAPALKDQLDAIVQTAQRSAVLRRQPLERRQRPIEDIAVVGASQSIPDLARCRMGHRRNKGKTYREQFGRRTSGGMIQGRDNAKGYSFIASESRGTCLASRIGLEHYV